MNKLEVSQLLTYIAELDGRQITRETVTAWHDVLGEFPLADCHEAVKVHFRDSTDWLKPGHIAAEVRAVRRRRFVDFPDVYPNRADMGESQADYLAAVRGLRRAVGDGRLSVEGFREYQRSALPLGEFLGASGVLPVPVREPMPDALRPQLGWMDRPA